MVPLLTEPVLGLLGALLTEDELLGTVDAPVETLEPEEELGLVTLLRKIELP